MRDHRRLPLCLSQFLKIAWKRGGGFPSGGNRTLKGLEGMNGMGCVQNWDAMAASNVGHGKKRASFSHTVG